MSRRTKLASFIALAVALTIPLVPYLDLSGAEQEAIHDWLTEHGVDHTQVPVGISWTLDAGTGEWCIPIFPRKDGRFFLRDGDELAVETVRRVGKRPLPWRQMDGIPNE